MRKSSPWMQSGLAPPCTKYGLKKLDRHASIRTFSQRYPLGLGDKNAKVSEVSCLFDYSGVVSGICTIRTFT